MCATYGGKGDYFLNFFLSLFSNNNLYHIYLLEISSQKLLYENSGRQKEKVNWCKKKNCFLRVNGFLNAII